MPNDEVHPEPDSDSPSIRQRLHSATGDREAEAEALADRAGTQVSEEDAEVAVRSAHGDITDGPDRAPAESELASTDDAEAVQRGDTSD